MTKAEIQAALDSFPDDDCYARIGATYRWLEVHGDTVKAVLQSALEKAE